MTYKKKIRDWIEKKKIQFDLWIIDCRDWQGFFYIASFSIFWYLMCLWYISKNWEQVLKNPIYPTGITWFNDLLILFCILSAIIIWIAIALVTSYIKKNNFDSTKKNKVLFFLQLALIVIFVIYCLTFFSMVLQIAYNLWIQSDTLYTSKILSTVFRAMTEMEAKNQFIDILVSYGKSSVPPEELSFYYILVQKVAVQEELFESCYNVAQDREHFTQLVELELETVLDSMRSLKQRYNL